MKFVPTPLEGAFVVQPELIEDGRGFFARSYCHEEFRAHGLDPALVQCNISFNRHCGTLRGLHYQEKPNEEAKLVRCTWGAVWDVIVDLRKGSPTCYQWFSIELTAANHTALYVPPGFAHGFQTLTDDSEMFYQMSKAYHPESARVLRWDDPVIGIRWPLANPVLSLQDRSYVLLDTGAP